MIKTVSELKEFIVWAKSQKVKSVKLGDIHVELSDLALISDLQDISSSEAISQKDLSVPASSPKLPGGNAQLSEEEELLFYSTR
jgi:hypothetical protein